MPWSQILFDCLFGATSFRDLCLFWRLAQAMALSLSPTNTPLPHGCSVCSTFPCRVVTDEVGKSLFHVKTVSNMSPNAHRANELGKILVTQNWHMSTCSLFLYAGSPASKQIFHFTLWDVVYNSVGPARERLHWLN